MIKFRTPLNILMGRIRYGLARIRLRVNEVCELSPEHWRWASTAILLVMGLVMAGMGLDFIGSLHLGIFLLALGFFLGLSLMAGLGMRLGLKLLFLLPPKVSWIYFGAVFFVFFMFGSTGKANVVIAAFLVLSASFLGAGLYNVSGRRWISLTKVRRVLTLVFLALGALLFFFGWFFLLYPGKAPEEVKAWAMESKHLPEQLKVSDPSQAGSFPIDSLFYGWGKGQTPKEIWSRSRASYPGRGWQLFPGWLGKTIRKTEKPILENGSRFTGAECSAMVSPGRGPFPLVLMVHGNHLDRDFSDPGYAYLGRHFASHGIIAVSVDENFLNGAWSDNLGD